MPTEREKLYAALAKIRNAKTDREANKAQAEATNIGLQLSRTLGPADKKAVLKSLDADIAKANKERRAS